MTPEEFKRHGIRMYGRLHWRREYSINLGLDASTVWRMSTRTIDIPHIVEVAVRGLLAQHRVLETARKSDRKYIRKARKRRKERIAKKQEKENERPLETSERPGAISNEDTPADPV